MGFILQDEIDRYNKEAERYIGTYPAYLLQSTEYENLKRRSIRLDIALSNDGTLPAEDIDVYIHFPDGFQLLNEQDLLPSPQPPPAPTPPMTELEKLSRSMSNLSIYNAPLFGGLYDHIVPSSPPPNVSSPHIKHTNSYDVHFHVQRVKHNMQVTFDPLFVIFDSFDSTSSFTIDYRILAANLPHKVTGNLHVVIEKETS